jgi:curved DNA-binding protein CbpA
MADGRRGGRQDHYEVLGVSPNAPDEVIRAAYRALATKYHPDRNPGDRGAELQLKRLNAAFQVLGEPEKRKHYDELTQSPEARDEAFEGAPHEAPKREPSRVEKAHAGAAGGYGRAIVWLAGCTLVAAVVAIVRVESCGEKHGASGSASATTERATAASSVPSSPTARSDTSATPHEIPQTARELPHIAPEDVGPDDTYNMFAPDGQRGTVPTTNLQVALDAGFKLQSQYRLDALHSAACAGDKVLLGYSNDEIARGYNGPPRFPSSLWDNGWNETFDATERRRNPPLGSKVNHDCGLDIR